jgi:hypothetical protein
MSSNARENRHYENIYQNMMKNTNSIITTIYRIFVLCYVLCTVSQVFTKSCMVGNNFISLSRKLNLKMLSIMLKEISQTPLNIHSHRTCLAPVYSERHRTEMTGSMGVPSGSSLTVVHAYLTQQPELLSLPPSPLLNAHVRVSSKKMNHQWV